MDRGGPYLSGVLYRKSREEFATPPSEDVLQKYQEDEGWQLT